MSPAAADPVRIFRELRSGVAQVLPVQGDKLLPGGSGFLVDGGLITNYHVARELPHQVVAIRFDGQAGTPPRFAVDDVIAAESPEGEKDFAFLQLDEPEFQGRHRFKFAATPAPDVGVQVGFLGYPFSMEHLTCHLAYVSAVFETGGVLKYQLDGSVNGGNSGGPMVDLDSGEVVGIVTRAEVGFVVREFQELLRALQENQQVLKRANVIKLMGIDLMGSLATTHAIMEKIAVALRRSANVGIGYAFSSKYVQRAIAALP